MSRAFKFLVIADKSPEFPSALAFAALRARATGGGLVMLSVVEPTEAAGWAAVEAEMRREAIEEATALAQQFAAQAMQEAGVAAEVLVRDGSLLPELRKLMEEDVGIRFIVLAAGAGSGGPGPLVSALARGQGLGGRAAPVVIVPAGLSREELRALAAPLEGGEGAPQAAPEIP